jgi:hypothetical protein
LALDRLECQAIIDNPRQRAIFNAVGTLQS